MRNDHTDVRPRHRNALRLLLLIACLAGFFVAAQVSLTTASFQEGEVVSAEAFNDLLNGNFGAVGDALDDLEADKQERIAQTCPSGSAIRAIDATGAVTCQSAGLTLPYSGLVSTEAFSPAFRVTQMGSELGFAVSVRADGTGFAVDRAGGNGLLITRADGSGINIQYAGQGSDGGNGVHVREANGHGFYSGHTTGNGLHVHGAAGNGVHVETATGYGGRFRGVDAGVFAQAFSGDSPDLILGGGGTGTGDGAGRISSDPAFWDSSIILQSYKDLLVHLDSGNVHSGVLRVINGQSQTAMTLSEAGNMELSGTLTEQSSRDSKNVHAQVDGIEVLERLANVEISRWSYLDDPGVEHIGPMAQDFHAAFGVGADDTSISTIDRDGVALAAIQGLFELVNSQQEVIDALQERIQALEAGGR